MKFSVIIPLYNKAPYIRKALESVFAQTYTDYELIIVDDGSTDDSAKVAEEFINSSLPFREGLGIGFFRQPNAGVSAARNNGVAQAQGEYLAFLDADDWWEPTYLERMVQLITDYPDAGLYACNYYYHKDGVNIIKVDIPTGYFNYPKEYFKNFAMPVWTGATMIPRKVYEETGGFPVGIKLGEDFLLWAKIAMQYPTAFLNEPLAYYNNTLPPNYRATYHLHKPEEHMLFRLELLDYETIRRLGDKARGEKNGEAETNAQTPYTIHHTPSQSDWKRLLDMLRLHGLYDYWLSDEYYELTQQELDKVDWSQQYDFLVKMYRFPRWILRIKQRLLRIASRIKHALLPMIFKNKKEDKALVVDNQQYRKSLFKG